MFEDLTVASDGRSQRYDNVHEMAEKPVLKGFLGFVWAYWIRAREPCWLLLSYTELVHDGWEARTGCKGKRDSATPKA